MSTLLSSLSASLRERIAAVEAGAKNITENVIPEYRAITDEVSQLYPHANANSVFTAETQVVINNQIKLYEQARPIQRHLSEGPWALTETRFSEAFGTAMYFNYKFMRALRNISKLDTSFESVLLLMKEERSNRINRPRPLRGTKKCLDWQLWDAEQVLVHLQRQPKGNTNDINPENPVRISPEPDAETDAAALETVQSSALRTKTPASAKRTCDPPPLAAFKRRKRQSSVLTKVLNNEIDFQNLPARSPSSFGDSGSEAYASSSCSVEMGRGEDVGENVDGETTGIHSPCVAGDNQWSDQESFVLPVEQHCNEGDDTVEVLKPLAAKPGPSRTPIISLDGPFENTRDTIVAYRYDDLSFDPGRCLNDEAITRLLEAFLPLSDRFRIVHPAAINTALIARDPAKSYRAVMRDPRPDTLIVPLFWDTIQHWTLGHIQLDSFTITHFDSMTRDGQGGTGKQAHRALKLFAKSLPTLSESKWRHSNAVCPQQDNDFDCGVYVILNALGIMYDVVVPEVIDGPLARELLQRLCKQVDDSGPFDATRSELGTNARTFQTTNHHKSADSPITVRYNNFMVSSSLLADRNEARSATAAFLKSIINEAFRIHILLQDRGELEKAIEYFTKRYGPEDGLVIEMVRKKEETLQKLGDLQEIEPRWPFSTQCTESALNMLEFSSRPVEPPEREVMEEEKAKLLAKMKEKRERHMLEMAEAEQRIARLESISGAVPAQVVAS